MQATYLGKVGKSKIPNFSKVPATVWSNSLIVVGQHPNIIQATLAECCRTIHQPDVVVRTQNSSSSVVIMFCSCP